MIAPKHVRCRKWGVGYGKEGNQSPIITFMLGAMFGAHRVSISIKHNKHRDAEFNCDC